MSRRRVNKIALGNLLYQAEVHNRIREEEDMFKKRNDEKREAEKRKQGTSRKRRNTGSSDEDYDVQKSKKAKKFKTETYQVVKASPNTEKWGHSGFLEQYSDDVISGKYFGRSPSVASSTLSDSSSDAGKRKKKKSKKSKKDKKKKKKSKKSKHKKRKKE